MFFLILGQLKEILLVVLTPPPENIAKLIPKQQEFENGIAKSFPQDANSYSQYETAKQSQTETDRQRLSFHVDRLSHGVNTCDHIPER